MPRAVGSPKKSGAARVRRSFAKSPEILEVPNLIAVQQESFRWFQTEGIREVFDDFPIVDRNGRFELKFKDFEFHEPKHSPDECREKGLTFQSSLLVDVELVDRQSGEILRTELTYLGEYPVMTDRATFVINGSDRVVVSLLQRSPGVYFSVAERRDKESYFSAEIKPHRGAPLSFEIDRTGQIQANVNRSRKVPVTMLLRALDVVGIGEWIDTELLDETIRDHVRANQADATQIIDRVVDNALGQRVIATDEAVEAAIWGLATDAFVRLKKDVPAEVLRPEIVDALSGVAPEGESAADAKARIKDLEERIGVKLAKLKTTIVESLSSAQTADETTRAVERFTNRALSGATASEAVLARLEGHTTESASTRASNQLKKELLAFMLGDIEFEKLAGKVRELTGRTLEDVADSVLLELSKYSRADLRAAVIQKERDRIREESNRRIAALFNNAAPIMTTIERERPDAPVTPDEAVVDIHRRLRPGDQSSPAQARDYLEGLYYSDRYDLKRVGRYQMNKKFGVTSADSDGLYADLGVRYGDEATTLMPEDIIVTLRYLCALNDNEDGYSIDDVDHLGNRRVSTVGELLQNQFRVGFSRTVRTIVDRMSAAGSEDLVTPVQLINIKPIGSGMREFFNSSQLSQFMDQTNPVSGLAHKRRLSAIGRGGIRSAREAKIDVRDVHPSHYGRICPIETPEGMNIGLISSLATYAQVNKYGFVETPYRRVVDGKVTDQITYLTADQEERHVIAQASEPFDPATGTFLNERVLCRVRGAGVEGQFGEPDERIPTEVDFMDVSPRQMVSAVTALIPFLEHDDANRALMGANMQRQAVPLLRASAPLVGTGLEEAVAHDSGDLMLADRDGVVSYVDAATVRIQGDDGREYTYELPKFRRSNQNTCVNHRPLVSVGEKVFPGKTLADGPSTESGELALGQNLLVAFMPWEGYNFEDAIIISERVVRDDLLTSIHIKSYEIEARDTKVGPEEITAEVPNLSDDMRTNLDEDGIIRIGTEVRPGDVLVGKVTPKGETGEQSAEQRLLRQIFGEKAHDVRDTSLKVPHGVSGRVIAVQHVFAGEDNVELKRGVNEMVRVFVAQKRKIQEGDKLAGRHGNKGVISKVLAVEDMPFLADGTPVDIILNPLGVPSRMNVGQLLETHLGWAARNGWSDDPDSKGSVPGFRHVSTPVFDGAKENEIIEVIEAANANLHKKAEETYGAGLVHAPFVPAANRDGKVTLMDGRTGEPFREPVTVGEIYMLKLHHLVDDKIHARSTGPYSLVTQQPLGGKAQFGGQRFGEMEVWALYAYGAAYLLREIFTVKSDDLKGRVQAYKAITDGRNVPEPGMPESFNVLVRELGALGLKLDAYTDEGEHIDLMLAKTDTRGRRTPQAMIEDARNRATMDLMTGGTMGSVDEQVSSLLDADLGFGEGTSLAGGSLDDLESLLADDADAIPAEEGLGESGDLIDIMAASEGGSDDDSDEEE